MTTPQTPDPDAQLLHRRTRHVIGEDTLRWAIAGASAMARNHVVPAIRSQPPLPDTDTAYPITDSIVIGVYSRDVSRARQFAEIAQLPHAFVNLDDMLGRHDVDCIYVGGHPRHHAQTTIAALLAGKHVLCETPMALTLEDATAMTHTAASAGLTLGINYVHRADPSIRAMRELLIQEELSDFLGGRVQNTILLEPRLQTWRIRRNGGGVVFNRTIHDIDLVRYLLRDEVASVTARSTLQFLGYEVEEDIVAHLEMRRTGRIVELRDSFLIPHIPSTIDIYNSAGTLSAVNVYVDEQDSELHLYQNQRELRLPLEEAHIYRTAIARFNSAVRTQGQPLASAAEGLQNLTFAMAVIEALQTGNRITIPPVPRHPDDHSLL